MKNKLLMLSCVILSSCLKEPKACFTVTKTTVKIGEEITLNNCSENAKSYEWSLGDGTFSSERNLTHSYSQEGTYNIELESFSKTDQEGKIDIEEATITVEGGFATTCTPYTSIFTDATNFENIRANETLTCSGIPSSSSSYWLNITSTNAHTLILTRPEQQEGLGELTFEAIITSDSHICIPEQSQGQVTVSGAGEFETDFDKHTIKSMNLDVIYQGSNCTAKIIEG